MKHHLYHTEPYTTTFNAEIVEIVQTGKQTGIVLDRTAFYPEGGGQPGDRGWIAGLRVADTKKEAGKGGEDGDRIVHLLETALKDPRGSSIVTGGSVEAKIDWEHRFDYMQQHSGQHVLSGALMQEGLEKGPYPTVSVHQGADYTTIEVDAPEVPEEDIRRVEDTANELICRNVPVETEWATTEEIEADPEKYPLRREAKVSGNVRIVRIDEFDCVACGGVHVRRTGEIGLAKAVGTEKIRNRTRLVWKIGGRALEDYRLKTETCAALTDLFSAPTEELVEKAEALWQKAAQLEYDKNGVRERYAAATARFLRAGSATKAAGGDSGGKVVTTVFDGEEPSFLRKVAETLVETETKVCLVSRCGGRVHWCIAGDIDWNLVRGECLPLIDGKGGGRPPIWQGIGTKTEGVDEFLQTFREGVEGVRIE